MWWLLLTLATSLAAVAAAPGDTSYCTWLPGSVFDKLAPGGFVASGSIAYALSSSGTGSNNMGGIVAVDLSGNSTLATMDFAPDESSPR